MSTFKSLYFKAHNAQTQLLIDAGIQVDIQGYPLCSDSTLEKTLTEKQLELYDYYESKKNLLIINGAFVIIILMRDYLTPLEKPLTRNK